MRKFTVAAMFVVGSGTAFAADLPVRATSPAYTAPAYSWSGLFVGIQGGYGWGSSTQTDRGFVLPAPSTPTPTPPPVSIDDGKYRANGGFVGGAVGLNWQTDALVYGVEADYAWSDFKGSSALCGLVSGNPHRCGTKLESFGTIRGRLGYAFGPSGNWLLYGTGGVAAGELHGWDALRASSGSKFQAGWAAGAGLEVAITPNWTAKVEYLHMDLGREKVFHIVPGVPERVGFRTDMLRVGVNYKFMGPF